VALPPVVAAAHAFAAEVVAAAHAKSPGSDQIDETNVAGPNAAGHCDDAGATIDPAAVPEQPDQNSDSPSIGPEAQAQTGQQLQPLAETPPPPTNAAEPQQARGGPAEVQIAATNTTGTQGNPSQQLGLHANVIDTKKLQGTQARQTASHDDDSTDNISNQNASAAATSGDETTTNGKPHIEGEAASNRSALAASQFAAENGRGAPSHQHDGNADAVKTGADANQTLNLLTSTSQIGVNAQSASAVASAAASATANAAASPAIVVPMSALAVEIVSQAHAGKHSFEIRLDPPELGRINVRLDIDHDGNVTSRLVVDRSETLDLLRRDASQLERALQQAGLKMSDNALQFSLRQHAFAQNDAPTASNANQPVIGEEMPGLSEAVRQSYGRLMGLGGGLDIHV
jgi:flagellar hook-length control protein FliK